MRNPWQDLPTNPPYVQDIDRDSVEAFNRSALPDTRLHVELLPGPFIGNPDAPVVVLNLNPGYRDADLAAHDDAHFIRRVWANLVHHNSEFPFYFLDPECQAPGRAWWLRRLGPLIREVDLPAVARGVLCVEFVPYASTRYRGMDEPPPSQAYGFWLVRRAVEREAVVILMRGTGWMKAVSELAGYPRMYRLNSVQNVIVSRGNCPGGFEKAVRALSE